MGLEQIGLTSPEDVAKAIQDLVGSKNEQARRSFALERVQLYRDDYRGILRDVIGQVFNEPAIRLRMEQFIPLVHTSSFLKRVSDELARPLYARQPQRRVMTPQDLEATPVDVPTEEGQGVAPLRFKLPEESPAQRAWNALALEMGLTGKMDLVARMLPHQNHMFLYPRYVPARGMSLEVMTPGMVWVKPNPDFPSCALSITYCRGFDEKGNPVHLVTCDDKRFVSQDGNGTVLGVKDHPYGFIPIVEVHRRDAVGAYWDYTSGEDLVSTTKQSLLLELIKVRKLKTQSHIQLAYSGEGDPPVKDQVSDEETVLMFSGRGSLQSIDLQSDPTAILAAKEAAETATAASYGISRDRLNQKTNDVGEDVALKERVSELAQVLYKAEADVFRVVKRISVEHENPALRLPQDAVLIVDLGHLHNRVDRKTQLEVRALEKSQGIRSAVDDVLEDNPEFGGDRRLAMAYLDEKAREQAVVIARQRALNMPADGTAEEPGQDARANGALGPAVRDKKVSRDDAADAAKGGKDLRAIALRVLKGGKDAA
ncbi:MAG TPA: hypothetical protein VEJ18_19180 [Planctomycetota bacterium]|nr:hypothetical protein [Planctomycetota bacterium]